MRNLLVILSVLLAASALADTAEELAVMDALRTGGDSVRVSTRIEVEEPGEDIRTSQMDVYAHKDGRSLAVYRSEREAGQKVLMVDDQFWLFLPSSKRALRITPMQKLMGEASVGDVASMAWSADYDVLQRQYQDEEVQLSLEANRRGLSYQHVELWVDAKTLHPIRADFYLKSGKLAKQASFIIEQIDNEWQMRGLELYDRVQKEQVTRILYDDMEAMDMPDKWFNPNFLLRSTP